ncbi:MAG: acetyl-coenzyme A synthetase, partial [Blastomonas sp.]|nr:acetyl-coenzyme A synthetase [Blastomonas sp.]
MADAVYPVPADWAANALITAPVYEERYRMSIEQPDAFWREEAQRIDWIRPFTRVSEASFHEADFGINWFADGTLNLAANCLDRHLAERGDQVAILWEPDSLDEASRAITYRELHE